MTVRDATLTASDYPESRSASDFTWRSEGYAWLVVVLLTIAFTLSMIDRMILTLLVEPIKADFGLSDTQVSLLHGLAFTILYVLVGLPMGRLADLFSRRMIAGWSIFTWSLMTAACGGVSNFAQMFMARVGVGVGEAGLSPAAASLISDYFPKDRLSLPIAFFSIGGSAGAGLAYIFGGMVVDYVTGLGQVVLPIIGGIHAWQAAFFVVGVPGMLFAASFLFVREPERRGRLNQDGEAVPIGDVLRFMRERASFLATHFMAASFSALVILSMHAWMPTFMIRTLGLTVGEVGVRYGLAVLLGGVTGLLVSGRIANLLAVRGIRDSHIAVALVCALAAIVPAIGATFMPSHALVLVCSATATFGFAAAIALTPVALQIVIPNELRGQVIAVYLLILSLLGYTVGPLLVALFTDYLFMDEALVGRSMALVAAIGGPLSVLCFATSRKQFTRLLARQEGAQSLAEAGIQA